MPVDAWGAADGMSVIIRTNEGFYGKAPCA